MAETFFDKIYKNKTLHTPDVLSCLANLSNDEVFTPPDVVNQMLDLLPQELFRDPNATFLDPACKTGVFLREIAKRLIVGLADIIPDLQQRIDHIFHKQLYGIAITELTSLLSRRSLYCSKYPNGEYSISHFTTAEGNIRYRRINHVFINGKCKFCGANKTYDREEEKESHAYEFIHTLTPEKIFNMKFDVIISNPPYQLKTNGAQAQAIPLYHKFVQSAIDLEPGYLTMIIPSRWFTGGFGLDSFRNQMLNDKQIRIIHDFTNASDCFPGVEVKGGVCYFLWQKNSGGDCKIYTHNNNEIISQATRPLLEDDCDVFVRYNQAVTILRKVKAKNENSITSIISSQRPFGLPTNFNNYSKNQDGIKVYAYKKSGYIDNVSLITKNQELISKWKILTPKAIGSGNSKSDWVKPIIAEPNSVCTETYIVFGTYETKAVAENVCSYINTRFFHFLLTLRKNTQDALAKVYQFVPMQDFSKPWTDEELYKKYNLSQEEIDFIESMIKPME
ncbi:MAG: Eco57I restriction-modification methylase domain-containing protein [Clostridia bacterium]|nr:Eco57I restriction-modification methylase domain-containing protein [Clostridia bacterium]MDY3724063.1 Eco57I restriction-modification methylase domain-containing protein [Christensenellaceae bacterium]